MTHHHDDHHHTSSTTKPLSNREFLAQFKDKTLNPVHFKHVGHLRLAWIYLNHYDLETSAVDLVNRFDGSPLMDENLLFRFYSKERLFSIKARREWVAPDIQPLSKIHSVYIN